MSYHATAIWYGSGKEGSGFVTTPSTALSDTKYSFSSRFETGSGTNPEELLAAAHAVCFTMKLSFMLGEAGFIPEVLETIAIIHLERGTITASHLLLKAKVIGINEGVFAGSVKEAEVHCIISKVLNADIQVEYTLEN